MIKLTNKNGEYIEFDWEYDTPPTLSEEANLWQKAREQGKVKTNKQSKPEFNFKDFLSQSLKAGTQGAAKAIESASDIIKGKPEAISDVSAKGSKLIDLSGQAVLGVPFSQFPQKVVERAAETKRLVSSPKEEISKYLRAEAAKPLKQKVEEGIRTVSGTAFGGSNYPKNALKKVFEPASQEVFMRKQVELLKRAGMSTERVLDMSLNKGAALNQIVDDYIAGKPLKDSINELRKLSTPTPAKELPAGMVRHKSVDTALKSDLPIEVKEAIATNPKANYAQQSLDVVEKAANDIMAKGEEAIKQTLAGPKNAVTNTLSMKYANKLASEGKIQESEKIIYNAIDEGLDAGRLINSFKQWKKLDPAGILKRIQDRLIETQSKNPGAVTDAMKKSFLDEGQRIASMSDGYNKDLATFNLFNKINQAIPDKASTQLLSLYKAMLLTLPKSHFVNITSNVVKSGLDNIAKAIATPIDIAASAVTGKRTTTLPNIPSWVEGFAKGSENAKQYLKTGYDIRNVANKYDVKKTYFGNSRIGKTLQAATESIFRLLGAEDMPFWNANYVSSLKEQGIVHLKNQGIKSGKLFDAKLAELMNKPTEAMQTVATREALESTFQNETALNKVVQSIAKLPGGEILLPFKRTPSAFITSIVEYSPTGFVKPLIQRVVDGKISQYDLVKSLSRATTGTTILGLGYKLAEKGLLTGSYPSVASAKDKALAQLKGLQYGSIKIGPKYYSLRPFGVIGELLNTAADIHKAKKEGQDETNIAVEGIKGLGKSIYNQPFTTNISNLLKAFQDEKQGGRLIANIAGSFVPAIAGAVARGKDKYKRSTKGNTFREQLSNAIIAKIPGLREKLPPQVDVLGEKVEEPGTVAGSIFDVANVTKIRNKNKDIINEFERLKEKDLNPTPTLIETKEKFYGKDIQLSPKNVAKMQEYVGKRASETMRELMRNPKYKDLTDEEKSNFLSKIYNSFKKVELFNYAEQKGLLTNNESALALKDLNSQEKILKLTDEFRIEPFFEQKKLDKRRAEKMLKELK